MTQQEVSEIASIAPETLSRLERNKVAASLDLTARLAEALGVKLLNLVKGLDDPQVHELVRAVKMLMDLGAADPLRRPT